METCRGFELTLVEQPVSDFHHGLLECSEARVLKARSEHSLFWLGRRLVSLATQGLQGSGIPVVGPRLLLQLSLLLQLALMVLMAPAHIRSPFLHPLTHPLSLGNRYEPQNVCLHGRRYSFESESE
jgi:hypothetical protein